MANKTVPGRCSHCGAMYEVPAETIGLAVECPHCHHEAEILLGIATFEDETARKSLLWTVGGILVFVLALAAAIFAVHLAKRLMEEKKGASA